MSEMRAVADDGLATAPIRPLSRFGAGLDSGLRVIMALAIFGELTAIFMNVVSRYLFETSFLWVDDVAKIALSIIAFIGGAFAYRRNEFVSVRAFVNQLPVGPRHVCDVMIEFIVLASAITAGVASGPLLLANWHELMPILQIPETWIDIPLTIGMAILAVSVIERLLVQHRRTVLLVGFFGLLFIGIAFATNRVWLPWMTEDVALGVELIIFFALIVLGVPVGFALLNAALVFLCFSQPTPMVALPQNMVDGTTNFVLLAIPFFIFAGAIMEQGGLSRRFVRLVQAVVGHIRGGLLQVIVVSMYLVSGMSGSKAADVAAVGSVMRSMLRRQGYDMEEGTAVLAASAAMGETIPPSIAMLVLGSITTLSMASLFAAGLIPAAVLAVCLMVVVYVRARGSSRVPTQRASLQEMRRAAFAATLPLLMPAIIVVGVLGGIATPTEVSSFAVVYGLLLAMPLYREMDARKLLNAAVEFDLDVRHDLADTRHGHDVLVDPDDRLSAAAPGGPADHCSGDPLAVPDGLDCTPDRAWLNSRGTACASHFGAIAAADRERHGHQPAALWDRSTDRDGDRRIHTPCGGRILHFLCRAGHHGGAVLEGHGALFHHVVYRRGPGGPGPMVHYCVAQGVRSHHTIDALRHAEQREF